MYENTGSLGDYFIDVIVLRRLGLGVVNYGGDGNDYLIEKLFPMRRM